MAATLEVTELGALGDGIAELPEGRVFVPLALPGERVRARLAGRRAGHAVYMPEAWLHRAAERARPVCPHFGACGGCAAQHLADDAYARWKQGLLVGALARAGFPEAAIAPLVRIPPGTRRRADFALARGGASVAVGFHARHARAVHDLAACPVLRPELFALVAPLRRLVAELGCLRRAGSATVNLLDHGPDLLLRTEAPPDAIARGRLVVFARANHLVRLSWGPPRGPVETIAALRPSTITLSGRAVDAPAGAFLQASREGEAAILAAVLGGLPPGARRFADLYAGLGTVTFALAGRGRVGAYEADAAAAAALAAAAAGTRVGVARRDLVRQPLRPEELDAFDAVVLDPPFAGAAEQIATLAASRIRHIVYVSCNPAALARDARRLHEAGFALATATPIDQFLWSAELEAVAHFAR